MIPLPTRLLKLLLVPLAAAVAAPPAGGATGDAGAAFRAGVDAYEHGDFAAAAEHFEADLAEGESASARHNLAAARFRLGQPGEAAWQLERALVLEPLNPAYRAKLAALRRQIGLLDGGRQWLSIGAAVLPLNDWLLLACAAFWLPAGLLTLPRLAGRRPRFAARASAWACLLVFAVAATAAIQQSRHRQTGIVVTDAPTELKAAPAAGAPVSGLARPGERARIKGRQGGFHEVLTESGTRGWLGDEAFRPLFPGPTG